MQNECHATISVVETQAVNRGLVKEKRIRQNEAISLYSSPILTPTLDQECNYEVVLLIIHD